MKKFNKSEEGSLRQKAEELLEQKNKQTGLQFSESEILKLKHELEVYQIELEMQNEELKIAKNRAEGLTGLYTEFYDFAQPGYLTLSREGKIIDINLSGSQMLGKERLQLKNSHFTYFLSEDTKQTFQLFFTRAISNNKKEACEVTLLNIGGLPINVELTGLLASNKENCLITG